MSKLVDVNNVQTYPNKLLESFENNIEEINYDEIFKDCYFKCCHVCCTNNIDSYTKYGIMRPYIVNGDGTRQINETLKKILFRSFEGDSNLIDYEKRYDALLEKEYLECKVKVDNWYGKYSCVCFTLDSIEVVNVNNSGYEPLIKYYGGEIFRDLFGEDAKKVIELGKQSQSYAIFFQLSYDDMKSAHIYFGSIINHMRKMYKRESSEYSFEGHINKDISPSDFIEVKELKVND